MADRAQQSAATDGGCPVPEARSGVAALADPGSQRLRPLRSPRAGRRRASTRVAPGIDRFRSGHAGPAPRTVGSTKRVGHGSGLAGARREAGDVVSAGDRGGDRRGVGTPWDCTFATPALRG